MSLSIDGFWKSGFWTQTFWADGFWFEGSAVVAETPNTGGWPYEYRPRKKKVFEEIEEKIEVSQTEIEDLQARLLKEKREKEALEARARISKSDQTAIKKLKAGIASDLSVIEEMRRIHDELITLRALEFFEDQRRKKRNQIIAMLIA